MPAWILGLLKYIPGLTGILDKFSGNSAKADELRAKAELEDIKGFHKSGRISARHLWKYVKIALAICAVIFAFLAVYDERVAANLGDLLESAVVAIERIFSVGM